MRDPLEHPLKKLLALIPVIILTTIVNVFITSIVSGFVFLMLSARFEYHHNIASMAVAVLVAILTYGWIILNHHLRSYIQHSNDNSTFNINDNGDDL
jgi:energy-coupling factor transporter transmembrane protein EcfT